MNVMSEQGFVDLNAMVDNCIADAAIIGVIITSAKTDFAAGMDLAVIAKAKEIKPDNPAQGCFDMVMQVHHILRKIELAGMDFKTKKGGKPFVAVLPGTALGIGLEIPLACHHIIATGNPKAKIGLPEIKVGIFPGAGGTTRLVRKMGAMAASPFLLQGKLSTPPQALAAGIIDASSSSVEEVVPPRCWIRGLDPENLTAPRVFENETRPCGFFADGGAPNRSEMSAGRRYATMSRNVSSGFMRHHATSAPRVS